MKELYEKLPESLLPWFEKNQRDLPWRKNREPYPVWLSEIMLQQTRVEAVIGYYNRFLHALPTIESLAAADGDVVHKLWEGLGYYSRVRNLQKAAQTIMTEHGGVFPTKYEDIRNLSGIGDYTAGAVCSICFNQRTPAVDGNVMRVLARVCENKTPITDVKMRKEVGRKLETVYPEEDCGQFTQAIMELGATVCVPNGAPKCHICPCLSFCAAYAHGSQLDLPVKGVKKKRREEDVTVFILDCFGEYAVLKRGEKGLLAQLWSFPNVEGILEPQTALDVAEQWGIHPKDIEKIVEKDHIFTHIKWNMRGVYLQCHEKAPQFHWVNQEEVNTKIALPTAFRQFWEK